MGNKAVVHTQNTSSSLQAGAVCGFLLMIALIVIPQTHAATPIDNKTSAAASETLSTTRHQIDALIEQLGDNDYHVRSDAQRRLANLGLEAFDALSEAEYHEDPEVAARAQYLLRRLQFNFADENDSQNVHNILHQYASKSFNGKVQQIRALASLSDGEGLAALCRLVRIQRSALLSKHAAAAILQWQTANPDSINKSATVIRQILANSEKPGARWLRESLHFSSEPDMTFLQWSNFIRDESILLAKSDEHTSPGIVKMLTRHELYWVFALNRSNKEKSTTFSRLLSLRNRETDALDLVPELVAEQAWIPLTQEPVEFAEHFAADPRKTLYTLAEALVESGKPQQAEQYAKCAFAINPDGNSSKQQAQRLATAYLLQKHGCHDWAEREYRCCTNEDSASREVAILASSYLAEMKHDQGQDRQAAEVLEEIITRLKDDNDSDRNHKLAALGTDMNTLKARRGFFLSEHYKQQGDRVQQRTCLEEALAADQSEVDVLIACYHLPDSSPEFRAKVKKFIRETVDRLRDQAQKNPGLPTNYNHLAWLVANTEGDLDEALRFSQKSLKLNRSCGGYYDTLARCRFARGELKKAVDAQARAVQLEPHSGLIARQLEQFKQALAEQNKKNKP